MLKKTIFIFLLSFLIGCKDNSKTIKGQILGIECYYNVKTGGTFDMIYQYSFYSEGNLHTFYDLTIEENGIFSFKEFSKDDYGKEKYMSSRVIKAKNCYFNIKERNLLKRVAKVMRYNPK